MKISWIKWAALTCVVTVLASCQSTNMEQFSKRYQYKLNHGRELRGDVAKAPQPVERTVVVDHAQQSDQKVLDKKVERSISDGQPTIIERIKNTTKAKPGEETTVNAVVEQPTTEAEKPELKRNFKDVFVQPEVETMSDDEVLMLVVLFILAFILPPLAVFLKDDGVTNRFWINLILWILGWGAGAGVGGLAFLLALLAVVHAILIVADMI